MRIKELFSPIQGFISLMNNLPWGNNISSFDLDIELFSRCNNKTASPLVELFIKDGSISLEDKRTIANVIANKHRNEWQRWYDVALSQYIAYENYNMIEEGTDTTTNTGSNVLSRTGQEVNNKTGNNTGTVNNTINQTSATKSNNVISNDYDVSDARNVDLRDNNNTTNSGSDTNTTKYNSTQTHGGENNDKLVSNNIHNTEDSKKGTETTEHKGSDKTALAGDNTIASSKKIYAFGSTSASPESEEKTVDSKNTTETKTLDTSDKTTHNTTDIISETTKNNETTTHTFNETDKKTGEDSQKTAYGKVEESTATHTGTDTLHKTGTETTTDKKDETVTDSGTNTQTSSNNLTETNTLNLNTNETTTLNTTNNLKHILTRHGNIGVTTNQQMLQSEIDLWKNFNLIDSVLLTIMHELTLPIYESED